MHWSAQRSWLLVGILTLLCTWGWNQANLAALKRAPAFASRLHHGRSLASPDDVSYLRPIDDLLTPQGPNDPPRGQHLLRTPGYGLLYLTVRLAWPYPDALSALVLLQCLLYAAAVALLYHTLERHRVARWARWTSTLLLATMPMFHGFLFHTLTEGLTPALCLAVLCCALNYNGAQDHRWLWSGVFLWAWLVLTRPVLVWAGVPLLIAVWNIAPHALRSRRMGLILMLGLLPTGAWWLRNVIITGGPISLHPVYSEDTNGIFRHTHKAFWELAKSWGIRGDAFHGVMVPAYNEAMEGRVESTWAEEFLRTAPHGHLTRAEADSIRHYFNRWQVFTRDQLAPSVMGPDKTLLGLRPEERAIIGGIERCTERYRTAHWFHHHVVVPAKVLRTMVLHSNLSLFMFQHPLRGLWWVELLRWVSLGMHLALFAMFPLMALFKVDTRVRALAIAALLYLAYLAYVQRGVEERYTLPLLPLAMGMMAFVFGQHVTKLRSARPLRPIGPSTTTTLDGRS